MRTILKLGLVAVLLAAPVRAQIGGGASNVGGGTTTSGGTSVPANSPLPAAISGPGPVFNVKNYGAFGDTRSSANCTISGSTNLNCSDVTFTAGDIGDRVSCASNFFTAMNPTTFTAFVDSHNMTVASGAGNASATCIFGHADDTAISAALSAATLQMCSSVSTGNLCVSTSAPTLYFPAGAYNLLNTSLGVVPAGPKSGFAIRGDGADQSKVYWHTGSTSALNAAVTCTGNVSNFVLENITFDGASGNHAYSNAVFTSCNTLARNVIVQRFKSNGWLAPATVYANKIVVAANGGTGFISQGGGEIYEGLFTNNFGAGLVVQNLTGANQGEGLIITNNLFDENNGASGCDVQIINSTDITFNGPRIFSSTGSVLCAVSVDANSFLDWNGGLAGVFGSEPDRGGIVNNGMLQMSGVHALATGTAKCITNNGILYDNGGNSCGTQFPIVSGTSTGTTAVLTLNPTTANVNTACSVGDALYVRGSALAGYAGYYPAGTTSGITATSATTLTYTTAGSNIGVLGAGGTASCLNLQSYTGNLPRALLNNPIPNTCYVTITPIVNATTYLMCNFRAQSATNITRIMASSQVTTTCATAPIVTISDGTASVTLTLTSAKSQWDSSVDTSTGVGTTIFKPNGTLTVKYDVAAASACATPPTQLAVSYNISPILSN